MSIFRQIGVVTVVVSAGCLVLILILLIKGFRERKSNRLSQPCAEWIGTLSIWIVLYGIAASSYQVSREYTASTAAALGNVEHYVYFLYQVLGAADKIALTAGVALVGLTARMILILSGSLRGTDQ